MHSVEYLLSEVHEKISNVDKASQQCEEEQDALYKNLASVKEAVDQSFEKQAETLQCRAKW